MIQRSSTLLLAAALLLSPLAVRSASPKTQEPITTQTPSTPAPAPPKREYPAPTNLQVLPKTLTGQQVHDIMEQWEQQTGMHCGTCHANDPVKVGPNGRPLRNFADDSKVEKRSARLMYLMNKDINEKYLSQSREFGDHVECGTCHRGHSSPPNFKPEPEAPHIPGAPAAPEHDHDHDHASAPQN
jgi:hypothetical protein